jgi:hypothetical protein
MLRLVLLLAGLALLVLLLWQLGPLDFAVAFLRRARSLAVAGVGLSTLAVLTQHRERRAA